MFTNKHKSIYNYLKKNQLRTTNENGNILT